MLNIPMFLYLIKNYHCQIGIGIGSDLKVNKMWIRIVYLGPTGSGTLPENLLYSFGQRVRAGRMRLESLFYVTRPKFDVLLKLAVFLKLTFI